MWVPAVAGTTCFLLFLTDGLNPAQIAGRDSRGYPLRNKIADTEVSP
jgi:hypothetical protein